MVACWLHQMETFSALLAICAGNSPVPGEFPTQRPVTRSFDVYFDLRPDKRLSKQLWGWWLETLSHSLWRHHNGHAANDTSKCIFLYETFLFWLKVLWIVFAGVHQGWTNVYPDLRRHMASLVNMMWYNHIRHTVNENDMMTSWNGNIFRVAGPLWGESIGDRWIPLTKPVTRTFDVVFDVRLDKRLNRQWKCWWFETPLCSCDVTVMETTTITIWWQQ